jgi:hypothetical protein
MCFLEPGYDKAALPLDSSDDGGFSGSRRLDEEGKGERRHCVACTRRKR